MLRKRVRIMVCQECNERPATVKVTKIVNGQPKDLNLCEYCADEKGDFFSFNNLLAGLLNMGLGMKSANSKASFSSEDQLTCPQCGLTYREFINIGRFGCTECYKTFNPYLESILKKLHGGNVFHNGKIPKRAGGTLHLRKQINDLKSQINGYVEAEEFEKAAEVRDQIRLLEKEIEASLEGGKNT